MAGRMYIFYCDETNLDPEQSDFFVYGGIAISSDKAKELHSRIEDIRGEAKFKETDIFKFNPCPNGVLRKDFVKAKENIIRAAVECGRVLIVSIILHKIGHDIDETRRNEINRVTYHFDCYLNRPKTYGLVLIDRFSDKQIDEHLRNKFSIGITGLPFTPKKRLENIIGFHYSAIGQSHFSSLIDIIIGSLRFSVNAHSKGKVDKMGTAKLLLRLIEPLFYRDEYNKRVHQISLNFSPNVIRVAKYKEQYDSLKKFFEASGIDAVQDISDERQY